VTAGVNVRERAFLPVTVNRATDGGVTEPAASPPAALAPGTIHNQLLRGEVLVEATTHPTRYAW
jgi:transposase